MSKPNQTVAPESVTPLPPEISKLTPKQTAVRIVEQSTVANRAFITVAMLLLHLKPTLKPGQTLGGLVIKLAEVSDNGQTGSVRRVKSTIDNARYAMRVWEELVEPGHIAAEVFHDFTFGDCLSINKAMSGGSRQKLTGADVALILQASPKNWHEEIECLFTYGQSLEDRRVKAETAHAAGTESKSPGSTPNVSDVAESSPDASASDESAVASAKADAAEPDAGNIVAMPKARTAEDAFKLITELEQLIALLPPPEVAKVAPALAELNAIVQSSVAKKPEVRRQKSAVRSANGRIRRGEKAKKAA